MEPFFHSYLALFGYTRWELLICNTYKNRLSIRYEKSAANYYYYLLVAHKTRKKPVVICRGEVKLTNETFVDNIYTFWVSRKLPTQKLLALQTTRYDVDVD